MQKRFGIFVGTGSHMGLGFDNGISGVYQISEKMQGSLYYYTGASKIEDNAYDDVRVSADLAGDAIGVSTNYFFGNSFFVEGGFQRRQLDVKLDMTSPEGTIAGKLGSTAWVAKLAVGNQWIFDSGLSLNFNWIGVHVPIVDDTSSSIKRSGAYLNNSLDREFSEVETELRSLGNTAAFKAEIGYMF